MKKKTLITFFSIILFSFQTFGQGINEVWGDYNHSSLISRTTTIFGDIGYRFVEGGETFMIRPSIKYTFKNGMQVMGGLGYFLGMDEFEHEIKSQEIRPWQGYRFAWPRNAAFALKHLVRLEESFVKDQESNRYLNPALRFRYQIGTDIDLWHSDDFKKEISIPIEYEVFYSVRDGANFVSRDRSIVGLVYVFSKIWKIEFNYIYQRDGINYGSLDRNRNIYRMRIRRSIGFKY